MKKKQVLGIYIRVSDTKQVKQGISLYDQRRRGIEWATKLNWAYELFEDPGLTGSLSYKDRPQLKLLVDKIIMGDIHGFFCVEGDRMSRQFDDRTILYSIFLEKKVKLFDYKEEIFITDPNVLMLQRIKSAIDDNFIYGLRTKVKNNLDTNIIEGRVSGGVMKYGYKKGPEKKLVISEDKIEGCNYSEAEVIRMIFKMAYDNLSMYMIAKTLNDLNIPTRRMISKKTMTLNGKEFTDFKWRDNTVFGMLKDSVYKGLRVYNKWKGKYLGTDDNGKKKYNKLNENLQFYEEPSLQIVPPTLFDAVQGRLANKHRFAKTTDKYEYLLKGLIECGKCGKKYYGTHGHTGFFSYQCSSKQHGKNCGNRAYTVEDLDKLISDEVLKLEDTVTTFFNEQWADNREGLKMSLDEYEATIQTAIEEKKRWLKAYGSGKLKIEDIDEEVAGQERIIAFYSETARGVQERLDIENEKGKLIELIRNSVKRFKKMKGFEERQNFIREIIDSVNIKWIEEVADYLGDIPHYYVKITYKFVGLEGFMINQEMDIDRSSKKGSVKVGKWFTKILKSKISLTNRIHTYEEGTGVASGYNSVDINRNFEFSKKFVDGVEKENELYGDA